MKTEPNCNIYKEDREISKTYPKGETQRGISKRLPEEMAEHGACIKLEIDSSKYSSFVPVIGVYIAGTSVVCFLAMLYDIFSAFRHKKSFIPCKVFSLNSLSLTLLAIAAKLQVDLTTPMPSAIDQVSKLSGNSLICISMGFFAPSLGQKPKHDGLTNMLALTIFVVTLIVNTCVQIGTGVIFFFIPQHIITMCCMLAMLCPLWMNFVVVATQHAPSHEERMLAVQKGSACMLQRLKDAYVSSLSINNDEMVYALSRNTENCTVVGLCIISVVSLVQPAIKNFSLEFCGGSSDYGKSVWVIVLVQILTVLTGTIAIMIRASGLSSRMKLSWRLPGIKPRPQENPVEQCVFHLLMSVLARVALSLRVLLGIPVGIVLRWVGLLLGKKHEGQVITSRTHKPSDEWLKTCELEELYAPAANYGASHVSLIEENAFTCRILPKVLRIGASLQSGVEFSDLATEVVACFASLQRLIEISYSLLPHDLYDDLLKAFCEVDQIFDSAGDIGYIGLFPYVSEPIVVYPGERGISISALREDLAWCEERGLVDILDYMESKYKLVMENDSDNLLLNRLVTRMFCELVKLTIWKVPDHVYLQVGLNAILIPDYRTTLLKAMDVLLGFKGLEDYVDWVYPEDTGITSLVTPHPPASEYKENIIVELE